MTGTHGKESLCRAILLHTSTNKFLAKWQGPYRVVKRIGKLDYLIEMPDRRRKKGVLLLKKWEMPVSISGLAKEVSEEDFPDWKETRPLKSTMGSQLADDRREEVERVLDEFQDVMSSKPGRTTATEHAISTESARPIRQAPYHTHMHTEKLYWKRWNKVESLSRLLVNGLLQ